MFTIETIIRPLSTADSEYSVCGNSVLRKAKVVDVFERKENGNNIKIEILEHLDPSKVGKKYSVDDRFFEAVEQDWIWINAYKATDEDMCCKDKQYLMGVEDHYEGNVALGTKGYHVCVNLRHCFKEYPYDFYNRFFKVKALVKRTDYQYRNPNNTILVAKAIRFDEEITLDADTIETYREYLA